jgi:hypothetical protein
MVLMKMSSALVVPALIMPTATPLALPLRAPTMLMTAKVPRIAEGMPLKSFYDLLGGICCI